jgi:myo-inositol 2-dehydrogenase/D-chiro-inositol 1-dehydrogenase
MAQEHAAAWSQTPARIAGFVSRDPARAPEPIRQLGLPIAARLQDLLPAADVVDICTPTPQHLAATRAAAAAGKHVVCEKPIARTLEQARQMLSACRAAGVNLLIAHVLRYFGDYAEAQAAVAAGNIGPPRLLRLARLGSMPTASTWFADDAQSGGVMLDLMIHDLDFARWLAGDVARVQALRAEVGTPEGRAQHASVLLTHRSGAVSFVEGSWANPKGYFRTSFSLIGAAGALEFDSGRSARPGGNPYVLQAQEFYEALAHDAPVRVTAEDALEALRLSLAAIESAATGRAVDVSADE